ncbi:MAG: efflux RND transporter permease subunit [Paludibacteraceae bacterium]|nr:efflux RND transporter permease subunit [Paludibacteraceae bacterium]
MSTRNHIEAAMRHNRIIYAIVFVLVAFGIFALDRMNKDEFPQVTIRQGLIVAVYPGATAQEVEEQVAKPIEQYLFTFQEIDKRKTYSLSKDGMCYVFAALSQKVMNSNEAWSKIRGGISLLRQVQLPSGLLAVVVIDDFGNTSSILLALESNERSPRELEDYANITADRLREINEMGSIKLLGQQHEEIAVTLDVERISKYSIDQNIILARLAAQGFRTMTGEIANDTGAALVHVDMPYRTEYELGQQIIFSDPVTMQTIRLRDIAHIERRYQEVTKYIRRYDEKGDGNCLLLNIEMQPGNNIVAFGEKVDEKLEQVLAGLPPDVRMHKITDQPRVVNASVRSFLKDLVVSVLIVIAVMLVLFPMRTALVSSTGLPVCIAITLGIMYLAGIELNTVTLAALIVVLGMVVDDSVIVIDGYSELLSQGHSRWYSAAVSTRDLFVPMVLATTSISGMFFPMLGLMTGSLADFIKLFPWAIFIALTCSILYAVWIIPFMASRFIRRKPADAQPTFIERTQDKFFGALQAGYQKLLDLCFRHPWWTIGLSLGSVVLGAYIFTLLDIQLMPKADRDSFAVEIHLTEGSSIDQTQAIVDSLGSVLNADERVASVTAFVGMSSPRFHATYAPQIPGENYAQFIVNTVSPEATVALIAQYQPQYENAFPNAYCRFKQLDYQAVANPIEIHVQGSDIGELEVVADTLKAFLAQFPALTWIHSNYDETVQTIRLRLKDDEASRLGVTQSTLSIYLNGALHGRGMTSLWEDGYKTPVVLYTSGTDSLCYEDIGNLMIPTLVPGLWVPLRQVADIEPDFHHSEIKRRNSIRTITVAADTRGKTAALTAMRPIVKYVRKLEKTLPDDVQITYGGALEQSLMMLPGLIASVGAALLVLLVLLVYHFKKLNISFLALSSSLLCLFGSAFGMWIFHMDISVTAILGVISLIGIIVRNAIIMYEYSDHLVEHEHLTAKEAAYLAGQRRMRPIFLTTATTALGVVPMILAATDLWMPMGVVICFGAILTMPMVVTLLPVAYWKLFEKSTRRYEK